MSEAPATEEVLPDKKRKLEDGTAASSPELVDDALVKAKLRKLLEPLSKEQLVDLLVDTGCKYAAIVDHVTSVASTDVAHRKIFVRGLAWDTTSEDMLKVFSQYGEIEEGAVVIDKTSGKSKGFGFVTFKDMEAAEKALAEPSKSIGGRDTNCNLAANRPGAVSASTPGMPAAPPPAAGAEGSEDKANRKLFVGGLAWATTTEKLLKVFEEFGEIEEGAVAMDKNNGQSRGFGFVTYKTAAGAQAALKVPGKEIDGRTTQCNLAALGNKTPRHGAGAGFGNMGMGMNYQHLMQQQAAQAALQQQQVMHQALQQQALQQHALQVQARHM